jgi:hypothetical protein
MEPEGVGPRGVQKPFGAQLFEVRLCVRYFEDSSRLWTDGGWDRRPKHELLGGWRLFSKNFFREVAKELV